MHDAHDAKVGQTMPFSEQLLSKDCVFHQCNTCLEAISKHKLLLIDELHVVIGVALSHHGQPFLHSLGLKPPNHGPHPARHLHKSHPSILSTHNPTEQHAEAQSRAGRAGQAHTSGRLQTHTSGRLPFLRRVQ